MDFKVTIKCNRCSCSFELQGSHIKECQKLECPNCRQQVPKEIFEKLKAGIVNLEEVPDSISKDGWGLDDGFEFAVKECPTFHN